MCGIAGFFVHKNITEHQENLKSAIQVLYHRGPDNQGIWTEGEVGLGHVRLSILDLTAHGNQPMTSLNGRYVISYGGEVYNYIEIQNELTGNIDSSSDTKVILEAISQWGVEKAVSSFNGMFAFALWDKHEKSLYLIRDSMGIKPLYWARVNGGILFASELKALKKFSSFKTSLNPDALIDYFSQQYIHAPNAIYQECYKLPPGTILKIDRNGAISESKISSSLNRAFEIKSPAEASEALEKILERAIQRHARSDVPIAAFLSGGVDSSLIVALLSKITTVNTYSIGYAETDFDESVRANKIAKHFGVKHETIVLKPSDVKICLDQIPWIYDEPFGDASCIPTYLLSQTVSRNEKVAFSGDGADELFGGYFRYHSAANTWNKINFIPQSLRPWISKCLPSNPSRVLQVFSKPFLQSPEKSLPYLKRILSCETILNFFSEENYLGLPVESFLKSNFLDEFGMGQKKFHLDKLSGFQNLLHYDQQFRLPDGMLTKVDRASMANALEVRVPFLDNELVAFARGIPSYFLSSAENPKSILKKILLKYLTREMVDVPKVGFHVPMKHWLRTHYRQWGENILFSFSQNEEDILNIPKIQGLWKRYCEGNNNVFYPIWSALMYFQWKIAHVKRL